MNITKPKKDKNDLSNIGQSVVQISVQRILLTGVFQVTKVSLNQNVKCP